jgi:WNK lysine deficient protein kinase
MLRDAASRRGGKDRPLDAALTDPTSRFVRQGDSLNVSPGLVRYLACDHETGLEVSWHELILDRWPSADEWPPIQAHCDRLKQLRHDSLFSFHHYWINAESRRITFITDAIPVKSVVEGFLRENQTLRPKLIARWFRPILDILRYLHSLSPPIVHGRIQPFSVCVRGPSIKVDVPHFLPPAPGGFEITPFTPPEVLSGEETPASDIWRFGLAMLSVLTRETPYAECGTPLELTMKLRRWQKPDCLARIEDPLAADLIAACLTPPRIRESAGQLFNHAYFTREYSLDQEKVHEGGGLILLFKSQTSASQDIPQPEVPEGNIPMQASQAFSGSAPRLLPKEK